MLRLTWRFALACIAVAGVNGANRFGALVISSLEHTDSVAAVPQRRVENGKGMLLMATGMFLFAAVDAGAKLLTADFHPFQIVWTRQLGLFTGALILLAMYGRVLLRTQHLKLQIARGIVATLSATSFIFAVRYVPLADAVAISFVAPFIVTVLGALVLREPVGMRRWIAVGLGFVGTLIVLRPGLGVVHPAAVLVLVAAFFFAVRQIISRVISDTDKTATTVVFTALIGIGLMSIPLPFYWQTPSADQIPLFVGVALLAAIAEVCVIKAFEMSMAVVLTPLHYSLLIWGTLYGWLLFDQLPDRWTLLGSGIILVTGLYMVRREYIANRALKAAAA